MGRKSNISRTTTAVWGTCLALIVLFAASAFGLDIHVVAPDGTPVTEFRWLLEEDNTHPVTPGVPDPDSLTFSIHLSCATVIASGDETNATGITVDPAKRYVVSILPDSGYSNGGGLVAAGQAEIEVCVNQLPLPTAQISVLVYHDNAPLNNQPDLPQFGPGGTEAGLEGFGVVLHDAAGQVMMDAFGNMLGTEYLTDPNGVFILDGDGNPIVDVLGDGVILTDAEGWVIIKYVAPNKYGVVVVPPTGQGWLQTSTIEGTPTVDTWVKPDEQPFVLEFGPPTPHIFIGFVKEKALPLADPADPNVATVTGRVIKAHTDPTSFFLPFPGPPAPNCYVGLNRQGTGSPEYVFAGPCDAADGTFTIPNVPAGLYQIVFWDRYLDIIFFFQTLTVPLLTSDVDIGDVITPQWFGQLEGYIFDDLDRDGFMDPGETGVGLEAVLLRFRDGTIYKGEVTDPTGFYQFPEVFPFFHYLVAEVGFPRYFATGATSVVDAGGLIPPDNGWVMPSDDKRNPQMQAEINPNTGNNLSRTETAEFSGEVLLEAVQTFADQNTRIDWGKDPYKYGENGGIAGIVFYATTRAEDDPRFAAGEPWEPGVGRVQIVLYEDTDCDGVIDDLNADGVPTLADVDNYPFGWADGGAMGPEDVKRNGTGTTFDPGDAIQITTTDCWDDNLPTGCRPVRPGGPTNCAEGQQTWNQVRPGVFDGGFAIVTCYPGGMASGSSETVLPPGTYIAEAVAPPGMEHGKEEDKNVDFGDTLIPSKQLLPPMSVGDLHLVPDELTLFPGIEAPFAGQLRPLPDRKQVTLVDRFNAPVEFFLFTPVPRSARVVGIVTDDMTNAFDPNSPNFGEKFSPPWLPVAIRDYKGKEILRVYTDEFGAYNALIPSTYTVNLPTPTGVMPQMHTICVNDPGPVPDPLNPGRMMTDPFFRNQWAPQCYTLDFWPGKVTYADTPVIPVGAFVGEQDFPLDCEFPDGTPLIYSVMGPDGGAYVSTPGQRIRIESRGDTLVTNPEFSSTIPGSQLLIVRDYGFGTIAGKVKLGCYELEVVDWANDIITATVPEGVGESERLTVIRGDNLKYSPIGVTLTVDGAVQVVHVRAGQSIQDAVDVAPDHALILVEPGVYEEMVIVWKNVKLQGSGAYSTIINALPFFPNTKLEDWRAKMAELIAADAIDLLPDQDPLFTFDEGAGVTVAAKIGAFGANRPQARIDGFTIRGSTSNGGVFVNAYAGNLQISNNKIVSNLGKFGGGIRIGHQSTAFDANNDYIYIHCNHVTQNTGLRGSGGILLYKGTDHYDITDNFICGNFTNFAGGGIGHLGLSDYGLIARNCIAFNEAFQDRLNLGGGGGAIAIIGDRIPGSLPGPGPIEIPVVPSPGTGSVEITGNLLQGNLARSNDGGAIYLLYVNGQDVEASPNNSANWYEIRIFNNLIVNNISALAGAISLQDAVKTIIINNTIAHNDSTATAALAFVGGSTTSTPQPSGVVGRQHSIGLANVLGATEDPEMVLFSNPILHDCIIHNNRSFFWDPTAGTPTGGGLVPNPLRPFWDIAVLPLTLGENLDPRYCLLTNTTGLHPTNVSGDPKFVSDYFNTIVTAAEFQEGGNFIDINFRPLTKTGDYHIGATSAATGQGGGAFIGDFVQLERDFDRDSRPFPAGGDPDIGADERTEDELIIDNTDPGAIAVGNWFISGGADPWDANSVFSRDAGDTFTFQGARLTPNQVFIWYTGWPSRSDDVQVEIFDGVTLLDTLSVDQTANVSQWNYLGTYPFSGLARVVITATGRDTSTNADAVRFVPVPPPELCGITIIGPAEVEEESSTDYDLKAIFTDGSTATVEADTWSVADSGAAIGPTGVLTTPSLSRHVYITVMAEFTDDGITKNDQKSVFVIDLDSPREVIVDNLDDGTSQTGAWFESSGVNPFGINSVYSRDGGNTFTFGADLLTTQYAVYMRWTAWPSRQPDVPVRIRTGGANVDNVVVNQEQNPGMWNLLGVYTLGANTEVIITSLNQGSTNADAVRFLPVSMLTELVMDNDDPVATAAGSWGTSSGVDPYGSRSMWSRDTAGGFTYEVPLTGTFIIQGWWTEFASRYDQVPVEIWDGADLLATIVVDQTQNGGWWNALITRTFANSVKIVIVSETEDFTTNADAFRLIPVP